MKRTDKSPIRQNLGYQNQNNVDEESNKRLINFYEKGSSFKSTPQKKAHTQTNDNNFITKRKGNKPSILNDSEQKKERIYTSNNKSRSNSKDNINRSRSLSKEKRDKTPIKEDSLDISFKEVKKGKMPRITSFNNLTLVEKNSNENLLYDANAIATIYNENDEARFKDDDIRNLEEVLSNYQNYEPTQDPQIENADMTLTGQDNPNEIVTEALTVIKLSN